MTLRLIIPILFICANVCAQTLVLQGTNWNWRGTAIIPKTVVLDEQFGSDPFIAGTWTNLPGEFAEDIWSWTNGYVYPNGPIIGNESMTNLTAIISSGSTYWIVADRLEGESDGTDDLVVTVGGASHTFTNTPPGWTRTITTGIVVAVSAARPLLAHPTGVLGQKLYSIVITDTAILPRYFSIKGSTE